MRLKTWLVAALGLGSLVILIAVSMLASSRRAQNIYAQLDQLNAHHRNVEAKLRALRSDVHLSSIFVRDYLLDVARERAPEYREQLAEFRRTSVATLEELRPLVGRDDQISSLQTKLAEYWETFDPLFDWTPIEKISSERDVSAKRGPAASGSGTVDRTRHRGAEQRESGGAERGGRQSSHRTPQRPAPADVADGAARPGGRAGRRVPVAFSRAAI